MRWKHIVLLAFVFVVSGCSKEENMPREGSLRQWMSEDGKKKVLCTTAMVRDLVQHIGGENIATYALIQGESDPHSYQLVKGDDEKFLRADLIFYNGLGLEHGPSLAHLLEHNKKAHSVGGFILEKAAEQMIYIDTVIDPHVWMDARLWSTAVPQIAEMLSTILPECKEIIKKNKEEVMRSLLKTHEELQEMLQKIPNDKRYLVTTHDAFNYFTRAYLADEKERKEGTWMRRCRSPEGLAPDSQLSTADIHRLVEYIAEHKISSIFAESNVSRDSIKKLVDACLQKGYTVHIAQDPLFADSMGPSGSSADTYIKMMDYDGRVITKELQENVLSIKSQ